MVPTHWAARECENRPGDKCGERRGVHQAGEVGVALGRLLQCRKGVKWFRSETDSHNHSHQHTVSHGSPILKRVAPRDLHTHVQVSHKGRVHSSQKHHESWTDTPHATHRDASARCKFETYERAMCTGTRQLLPVCKATDRVQTRRDSGHGKSTQSSSSTPFEVAQTPEYTAKPST